MIRPVERFAVNIGGLHTEEETIVRPPRPAPSGVGPIGLVAAACLGATFTLLAQRLLEEGRLVHLLVASLRGLAG